MFNQEHLAAIAAAISVLQQQLQSSHQTPFQPSLDHHHHQQQELQLAPSPPKLHHNLMSLDHHHHHQQQQQQQQHNHLQQELQLAPSPRKLHHNLMSQYQHQTLPAQTQRSPPQAVLPKEERPVSYSAIVAKSAGHSSNNNSNNNNIISTTTNNNNHHHHLNNNGCSSSLSINNGFNIANNNSMKISHPHTGNNFVINNNLNNGLHNSSNLNKNYLCNFNPINNLNPPMSINPSPNNTPTNGSATNLLGFMGLYVGNLSPDLTKEQLEKIFSKYGEPVKAHRLIRSPVAFIKYENTESPRAAIDDLFGLLLPELTLNQDQPLKLHFDRNDAQLKANYRPNGLPPDADNGECYGWRTTVCRRGKNCPKKHIPINRGIDFQMWMIKSTPTSVSMSQVDRV